jgi:hypothetical protein
MAFFQNLFNQEFRGTWVLGDRQYSINFICPPNKNSSDYQYAFNPGPWDFSVDNNLILNYAWDVDFKNYAQLSINIAGSNPSVTTSQEVAAILNSNVTFSEMYTASVKENSVLIQTKPSRVKQTIKLWISNDGAEKKMGFNKRSGIAELPNYFEKHTIENRFKPDSTGQLILLDETDALVDIPIIESAGFVIANMKEDWQLIRGRASGLFTFQKISVDGSDRISEIIEYPAGALEGDFARKIKYVYSGANTNPSQVTEVPYVLTNSDLVTP